MSRIVGEHFTGKPAGAGTDANVLEAIYRALEANGADLSTARYVNAAGQIAGTVGQGSIPGAAAGVVVEAAIHWKPFFLGVVGVNDWSAGSTATALTKGTAAGGVLPIGIQFDQLMGMDVCEVDEGCDPQNLTSGSRIQPGGFGWLSFGSRPEEEVCEECHPWTRHAA